MAKKRTTAKAVAKPEPGAGLHAEVRQLIADARQQVHQAVNAALTLTHWRVGDRIRREVLREQRADYGDEIVATLSRQLEAEFGRGYSAKSLRHMMRFAEVFPDSEIVSSLMRQLSYR